SASYSAGTWTVSGGGADIWNTADQFHFAYENGGVYAVAIAQVTSLQETDPWAKAGVMFRDSNDPSAMFADVLVTPGNGVSFQWRDTTGGGCNYSEVGGIVAPFCLKMLCNGTDFFDLYHPDVDAWSRIGLAYSISI